MASGSVSPQDVTTTAGENINGHGRQPYAGFKPTARLNRKSPDQRKGRDIAVLGVERLDRASHKSGRIPQE